MLTKLSKQLRINANRAKTDHQDLKKEKVAIKLEVESFFTQHLEKKLIFASKKGEYEYKNKSFTYTPNIEIEETKVFLEFLHRIIKKEGFQKIKLNPIEDEDETSLAFDIEVYW